MVMVTEPYIYITFHSQMANFPKFEMELGLVDKFSINLHLDNSLEIYEATFIKRKMTAFIGTAMNMLTAIQTIWFRCQTIRWRELPLLESE